LFTKDRFEASQPWISLVVRLAAAVIMIWAGVAKLQDLPASVRAVRAYELVPETFVPLMGNSLPFIEILVGFFLLFGLLTRATAIAYMAMLVGFLIGLVWAWSNGLNIDCGCFGGGGELAEGEADYAGHLIERLGFMVLGTWLIIWPRSKFSADGWLRPAS